MSRIRLTWNNASTTIVEQRVYRSTAPLDIDDMPAPLAVLPRRDREYLDSTIEDGLAYYYAVSSVLPDYSELISEEIKVEATPGESDPHWDKVVALLHFDGDLTDEKGNTWTQTRAPNFPSEGVAGTEALDSACFTSFNLNFDNLNTNSTVEMYVKAESWSSWSYLSAGSELPNAFGKMDTGGVTNYWSFGPTKNGYLSLYAYNNNNVIYKQSSILLPLETLVHVGMCIQEGVLYFFVDGQVENMGVLPAINQGPSYGFAIGKYNNLEKIGIIDDVRITKGVARYTANFTPPTEPFPNN